jgi:DNA modification methylase
MYPPPLKKSQNGKNAPHHLKNKKGFNSAIFSRMSITITQRSVGDLIPYARNSRTHSDEQVAQIAASIKEFGWTNPILVDAEGVVIAGHGRLMAARKLGYTEVPTIELSEMTETQKKAYVIADNRLALNAGWDNEMLTIELNELLADGYALDILGFDAKELDALLEPEVIEGLVDEDEVPEVGPEPITKPGDVWVLGNHRLMCGDSKSFSDIEKLLKGKKINLVVTSPPYASQRTYDEGSGFKPVHPDEFVTWYQDVASNIMANLANDGSYFCNIKPNAEGIKRELYVFDLVLAHVRDWGWNFADEFCWERSGIPQQVARRFKNQFEPIYHFTKGEWKFRPESVKHESKSVPKAKGKGAGNTNAANRQGHVSAVDGNDVLAGMAYPGNRLPTFQSEALGHPAAYPVGLPEFFIKAYTDAGDVVFDPFMGSGSTLMASEKQGRIACGTELSPKYCDVIVKRWEDFTGKKAVLEEQDELADA